MRKKNGLGKKVSKKVLRKMIKLGLIFALVFFLLTWALDILNNMQHEWDIFIKRHYEQGATIEQLQQEIEMMKSKSAAMQAEVDFVKAGILNHEEEINII